MTGLARAPIGQSSVGFIGLGNMGHALATNLVNAGHPLVCHDVAGPSRAPTGSHFVPTVAEVTEQAGVIVFCLPDGTISTSVANSVLESPGRTKYVVDTSTIGVTAARSIAASLAAQGIGHIDAAVSGGVAGARARTLAVMYSGPPDVRAAVQPVLTGLSDRLHPVGDHPGLAQAVKLANNFLSATALAATSEAIAFGQSVGLDMATMLAVLNTSSGRNGATGDKFPNHVLTGKYASGFTNSLMTKDLQLYLSAVHDTDGVDALGSATAAIWEKFAATEPGADFTRIYPFLADHD